MFPIADLMGSHTMRPIAERELVVARLAAGNISQQALARELGIPQSTINRIWQRHLKEQNCNVDLQTQEPAPCASPTL